MHKLNILFITVDSWNRNFVGCYNENVKLENITPNLDEWSKNCITFLSAFSPSVKTSASFLAILSGCYPSKYGDWFTSISENRRMISEIMLSNGYTTFGFTSNPCTSSLRGYDRGFKVFKDDNVVKDLSRRKLAFKLALRILSKDPYSSADQINSQVLSKLNKTESPFFVWIHYMDIHGPYISKNGWQLKNRISATRLWKKALNIPNEVTDEEKTLLKNIYKEKVRFLDYYMIDLIKKIDDENTIIIITADHGDVFGERGYFGHPFIFYNEMINVPLFIKLPSKWGISNKLCRHPVSLVDLVPTILDLLRIKIETDFDGNSLLPVIQDRENEYKTKYIFSEISRKYACAIKGHWKLIADYGKSNLELYNLAENSEETKNLVSEKPEILEELNGAIKDHIDRNKISAT